MGSPWACVAENPGGYNAYPCPVISHSQERPPFFGLAFVSVDQDSGFFDNNEDVNSKVSSNSNPQKKKHPCPSLEQDIARSITDYNQNYNYLDPQRHSSSELTPTIEPARKRFRGNCVLSLKEIPSWNIYYHDQRRHLAKFSDKDKGFQRDSVLNRRVSLSFYKNVVAKLDVDAVVSPTTESYSGDNGVAKLLHDEAGRDLKETCSQLPRCGVGNVEITDGFMLPARFIFHVNGPDIHSLPYTYEEMLHRCYENCLNLLVQRQLRTIAFPCISTGSRKGIPKNIAAQIALSTVRRFLEQHKDKVDRVVFCLQNKKDIDIYLRLMQIYFPTE